MLAKRFKRERDVRKKVQLTENRFDVNPVPVQDGLSALA